MRALSEAAAVTLAAEMVEAMPAADFRLQVRYVTWWREATDE